jgi:membrane protease YdiL (CAAX protease family)
MELYLIQFVGVIMVGWLARVSPRFQYRQIGFIYKQRDGLVALGLWAVLALISIGVATGFLPDLFKTAAIDPLLTRQLTAAVLGGGLVAVLLAARRQPLKSAGWGKATQRGGLMLGLALAFLILFLSGRAVSFLQGAAALPDFLSGLAVISLLEETVFRGYIQLRLDWWLGKRWGLALTVFLFLLWRLPLLLLGPVAGLPLVLGLVLIQAVLLGWLMQVSGHVLAPALYRFISMALQVSGIFI